jgi:predicted RNase H-like nuclease (RuvC/YqgF family)
MNENGNGNGDPPREISLGGSVKLLENNYQILSKEVAQLDTKIGGLDTNIQSLGRDFSRELGSMRTQFAGELQTINKEMTLGREQLSRDVQSRTEALAKEFADARRTNWPNLFGLFGAAGMVVAAGWVIIGQQNQLAVQPVAMALAAVGPTMAEAHSRMETLSDTQRAHGDRLSNVEGAAQVSIRDRQELHETTNKSGAAISNLQADAREQKAKLAEIETQFRAEGSFRCMQFAQAQRALAELWAAVKPGTPIPYPWYCPTIAQDGTPQ